MSEVEILGIDLGTTNSAIAIWEPETGQARVLHNQEGDRLTPSVVMFDPQTRQPLQDISVRSLLRTTAETAKIALTQALEHPMSIPNLTAGDRSLGLEATLTRTKLETLVQPFIDRTLAICDDTKLHSKR